MSGTRVVVACRLPAALGFAERPQDGLAIFESLVERAADLGGVVAASSYDVVVFSWDEEAMQEAVSLATGMAHGRSETEPVFACGLACGELFVATRVPEGSVPLQWGEPLAVASALARLAKPGEVLAHASVPAIATRELLSDRARVGRVSGKRIRGLRLDARQPWRAIAAADVARMVDPPLIGRAAELDRLMAATDVIILRADSGFGGSRMLAEVAAKTKPSRSITLTPFSAIDEPLGALRRAMALVAATERITLPPKLHPVLDRLLGAQGISVDEAASLIAHQIERQKGAPLPSLLLDDATDIDAPSIEACGRAIEQLGGGVRVVARIDSMSQLPRKLAHFSDGEEVVLGRLGAEEGQELAGACTGGALDARARVQWARRGGGTPLGIIEAVAAGIAQGDLLWSGEVLSPLRRTGGDDIARPVGYWAHKRAEALREGARDVLIAMAHLGGEGSVGELFDVTTAVMQGVELQAELVRLRRSRWIREVRPGTFGLVSRAHREAILEFSRNTETGAWRAAVAKTLERADGTLRRAEAAQNAARAGMGEWASRLAMTAARTAAASGLSESASALAAFAGIQDPGSTDLDLDSPSGEDDATLVAGANALAEIDELLAASEPEPSPGRIADRQVAGAAENAGLLDAARDLRETRWAAVARNSLADGMGPETRRRGLLALARAYADEGRSSEALIHALDALARMREAGDAPGTRTCLLFLARLYEQTERPREASTLKDAAQAAG